MIPLAATDYVWMIMIGMSIGFLGYLIFENHGISMMANVAIGLLASLFGGITTGMVGVNTTTLGAVLASIVFTLMFNIYNVHGLEKTVDDEVRILRKY